MMGRALKNEECFARGERFCLAWSLRRRRRWVRERARRGCFGLGSGLRRCATRSATHGSGWRRSVRGIKRFAPQKFERKQWTRDGGGGRADGGGGEMAILREGRLFEKAGGACLACEGCYPASAHQRGRGRLGRARGAIPLLRRQASRSFCIRGTPMFPPPI